MSLADFSECDPVVGDVLVAKQTLKSRRMEGRASQALKLSTLEHDHWEPRRHRRGDGCLIDAIENRAVSRAVERLRSVEVLTLECTQDARSFAVRGGNNRRQWRQK